MYRTYMYFGMLFTLWHKFARLYNKICICVNVSDVHFMKFKVPATPSPSDDGGGGCDGIVVNKN